MHEEGALYNLLQQTAVASTRHVLTKTYSCGCSTSPQIVTREEKHICVELYPRNSTSLYELLEAYGNEDPRELVCEGCRKPLQVFFSVGVTQASATLLVAVHRFDTKQIRTQTPTGPTVTIQHKRLPHEVYVNHQPLMVAGTPYYLRGIVEHRGKSPHAGHYIFHVSTGPGEASPMKQSPVKRNGGETIPGETQRRRNSPR